MKKYIFIFTFSLGHLMLFFGILSVLFRLFEYKVMDFLLALIIVSIRLVTVYGKELIYNSVFDCNVTNIKCGVLGLIIGLIDFVSAAIMAYLFVKCFQVSSQYMPAFVYGIVAVLFYIISAIPPYIIFCKLFKYEF